MHEFIIEIFVTVTKYYSSTTKIISVKQLGVIITSK